MDHNKSIHLLFSRSDCKQYPESVVFKAESTCCQKVHKAISWGQEENTGTSSQDFLFTPSLIPIFVLSYDVHVTFTQRLTTTHV